VKKLKSPKESIKPIESSAEKFEKEIIDLNLKDRVLKI
jgi:hypothetical protein